MTETMRGARQTRYAQAMIPSLPLTRTIFGCNRFCLSPNADGYCSRVIR